MSIMSQLFSAEDLRNLSPEKFTELRRHLTEITKDSPSFIIKDAHNRKLPQALKAAGEQLSRLEELKEKAGRVEDYQREIQAYKEELTTAVRKRAQDIFQQLTGRKPHNDASLESMLEIEKYKKGTRFAETFDDDYPPCGENKIQWIDSKIGIWNDKNLWNEFKKELLSDSDLTILDDLDENLDQTKNRILEFAIACEIDNFDYYYALRFVKGKVINDESRISVAEERLFSGMRLKDPDSRYSPFLPEHAPQIYGYR